MNQEKKNYYDSDDYYFGYCFAHRTLVRQNGQ